MFYIVKSAIYTHGVSGPYKTRKSALKAFTTAYEEAKKADTKDHDSWMLRRHFDGHHGYLITRGLPDFTGASETSTGVTETIQYEAIE